LAGSACLFPCRPFRDWQRGRFALGFYRGDFDYSPVFVVSGPLTHLLAVLQRAGAHDRPIFAEPLPLARQHAVNQLARRPGGSVFVIVYVRLCFVFLRWHFEGSGCVGIAPAIDAYAYCPGYYSYLHSRLRSGAYRVAIKPVASSTLMVC